jgi:ABC-type sugar transport system ATPase subunit
VKKGVKMGCFIEVNGVTKQFVGMKALDKVNFSLDKGEVRALLGINGAGKSTLIKVISGLYIKDEGEIYIDRKLARIENPQDAIDLGISTVYQDPQMIPSFTGYENIYLGNENGDKMLFTAISRRKLRARAMELLKEYPLEVDIDKPVYLLPAIEREIIAILRALSKDCRLLILDEPTSILTEKEKYVLFDLIRMLKSKGVAIIYITHHIDEVQQICDSYSVFRNGKDVAHEKIEGGKVDVGKIVEYMLGETLSQLYPAKEKNKTETEFEAKNVVVGSKVNGVSFTAKKGEVLGIFGLVGSGIDELSKAVFGSMACEGEFLKQGKPINLKSPKDVIGNGIFLVPGNRKEEGFLPGLSISFNTTIAKLKKILFGGINVSTRKEAQDARYLVDKMEIATPTVKKHVNELSGGNQQKVVVAKGLYTDADVYIFCEPTVGVDIGAKNKIYQTMRDLCKRAAVIILSSEPEEIYGVSDHIMVMHKGRITMEKADTETSVKEMLFHAVIEE